MTMVHHLKNAATEVLARTIGRTSDGIRICFDYGLTSGWAVEYACRNRPSGRGLIGKVLDRIFLAHPGWKAVRVRRQHLESLLGEAIDDLRNAGSAVSIVDIASGPAQYVLSVLEQKGEDGVFTRCRDLDERWLRCGETEAARCGLQNVHFERGDALDAEELALLRPRPNIAVVSAFYDWITDDSTVRRSMGMMFDALEPGGILVMTSQIDHPNLDLACSLFPDFNGEPLDMKMRPVSQVHTWLKETGFAVEHTLIDSWGYFAAIKARKP